MQKGFDFIGVSVVTICHDGNGKYLIAKRGPGCRDERGTWEPVGSGGVKIHESLEDAVIREVREESGAQATNIEPLGFRQVFREIDGKKSHWIAFDFKAQVDPHEVRVMEPDKCTDHMWCAVDEIPLPQHSEFPRFLGLYKDKL